MRAALALALLLAAGGCDRFTFACDADDACVRGGKGGRCLAGGAGRYCAFSDGSCGGGLRWDATAGGGLASTCVGAGGGPDLGAPGGADLAIGLPALAWDDVSTGIDGDLYCIFGTDAGHVWVVGSEGMWRSTNNGRRFDKQVLPGDARQLVSIWGTGSTLWAGGWYDALRTTDGASWSALTFVGRTEVYAVWGSGPADVYLVGLMGSIFHTVDGRTFLPSATGVSDALNGLWGSGPSDVYAVGRSGRILRSTNGGASWMSQNAARPEDDFIGVWGSGPDDVYAIATTRIYRRSGGAWRPVWDAPANTTSLFRAWGSGRGDVYVTGRGGLLLHSADDGASWQALNVGTQRTLVAVWGSGRDDVYVAGEGGALFHGTR